MPHQGACSNQLDTPQMGCGPAPEQVTGAAAIPGATLHTAGLDYSPNARGRAARRASCCKSGSSSTSTSCTTAGASSSPSSPSSWPLLALQVEPMLWVGLQQGCVCCAGTCNAQPWGCVCGCGCETTLVVSSYWVPALTSCVVQRDGSGHPTRRCWAFAR